MAADNQVVLEGIARFEALQRAVQQLVADAEGQLGKLGRNHPLVVDVAAAQVRIDQTLTKLRGIATQADRPTVLRVRTEDAETRVAALSAQVKQLGVAVTDFGPPDPLGRFRASVNQAGAAVTDFVSRTTAGSAKFGQSFEQAATRSKLALEGLQREIRDTAAAGSPIPPAVVAQVDRLETEYRQATTAAHQFRVAQAQVREGIRSATPPINELNNSLARVTSTVRGFIVAAALNELRQLGGESFQTSEQLKAIDRQLDAALGSSEKAAEGFAFVKAESDRLGFGLLGAVDAYARLSAAARGTSLEGEGINRVFTQFAERATVARLSSEDFAGVIRALEQIISKGTLSMEELRQQLGDRLPGTLRLAGKALGFTEGEFKELFDLVKSNAVSSIEFIQLFGAIVQREVAEKVPEASRAATAEVNRLKNEWLLAKAAAGDELAPAVGELAKEFRLLLRDEKDTVAVIGSIVGGFLTLARVGVASATATRNALGAVAAGFQAVAAAAVPGGAGFSEFWEVARERLDRARGALDRLQKSLFETEGPAAGAGAAAEGLGNNIDFAARKMDSAINEIIQYATEVEKAGTVQRAEADKIVKAVDKQLKAIRELPGAEGAAFQLREQQLVALRDRFYEFTTAYEKEQDKQAKAAERTAKVEANALNQRTDRFRSFLLDIKKLADAALAEASGSPELLRQRQEAEQELANLRAKPLQETEDVARADELTEQIRNLDREIQRVGSSAEQAGVLAGLGVRSVGEQASAAMQAFRDGLLAAVGTSEEFRSVFNAAGEQGRTQLEGLVRGLVESADAGRLAAGEVNNFLQTVAKFSEQAGITAGGFTSQIRLLAGETDTTRAAFDTLRASTEPLSVAFQQAGAGADTTVASLNSLAAAVPPATTALDAFLSPAERMAAAIKEVGFQVNEFAASAAPNAVQGATVAGEGFIRASRAAEDTVGAFAMLRRESEAIRDSSDQASAGFIALGAQTFDLQKKSEEAGGTLTTLGGEVIEIKEKAEEAAQGLKEGAEGAGELAEKAGDAATEVGKAGDEAKTASPHLIDFGRAAGEAGESGKTAAEGVKELTTAASGAREPVTGLVTALEKIPPLKIDEVVQRTAKGLTEAAKGAGQLATSIGKIETAATDGDPELQTLRDRGGEIAEKWKQADTAVAGFNERAGIAIGLCKELQSCLAGLAAS